MQTKSKANLNKFSIVIVLHTTVCWEAKVKTQCWQLFQFGSIHLRKHLSIIRYSTYNNMFPRTFTFYFYFLWLRELYCTHTQPFSSFYNINFPVCWYTSLDYVRIFASISVWIFHRKLWMKKSCYPVFLNFSVSLYFVVYSIAHKDHITTVCCVLFKIYAPNSCFGLALTRSIYFFWLA